MGYGQSLWLQGSVMGAGQGWTHTGQEANKDYVFGARWLLGWSHFKFRLFLGSCWGGVAPPGVATCCSWNSLPVSECPVLLFVPPTAQAQLLSLLRNSELSGSQLGLPFFLSTGNLATFRLNYSLCTSLPYNLPKLCCIESQWLCQ